MHMCIVWCFEMADKFIIGPANLLCFVTKGLHEYMKHGFLHEYMKHGFFIIISLM